MNSYCDFAEFYDELMSDVDYEELADYYNSLIQQHGQKIIDGKQPILLDLACGTGKLSALMAERGWDVIAIDSSPEMLSKAKPHPQVSYICQDMTELDLYGTINAAICTMDGLNHLADESELLETLQRVSLFMEEGGMFVFDMNTIYKHETILGDNIYIKETENIYCVWRNFYQGDGISEIELNIFAKYNSRYNRHIVELQEKAYESDTVRRLCEQAGFEVIKTIPYQNHLEKVVFLCRKNPQ